MDLFRDFDRAIKGTVQGVQDIIKNPGQAVADVIVGSIESVIGSPLVEDVGKIPEVRNRVDQITGEAGRREHEQRQREAIAREEARREEERLQAIEQMRLLDVEASKAAGQSIVRRNEGAARNGALRGAVMDEDRDFLGL